MATLSGNKIKDTYQSLIKLTDNGNLTTGAKQLTDGFGNNSPLYISTTQIGIGVTPEATYDLHVYSNAKVGGNLTVTGDLTVEGTTTTIDTQTLTVEDPLIEVASNNTSTDAVDIGWYGKYAPSGTVLYAGLFRDTGDSKFKLFRNLQEQPTTTVNTSGTGYTKADLVIGNLEATGADFSGQVSLPDGSVANPALNFTSDADTGISYDLALKLVFAGAEAVKITSANVDIKPNGTSVLRVDTTGVNFFQDAIFGNDLKAKFGGSGDLQIYHSATGDSYIANSTGDLIINSSGITGTAIKDEDNMASNSASHLATQQSIKAYVDTTAGNYLPLAGGTMSGSIAMSSNNISGGGTFTATTFSGQLNGTISSTTTATTQTQGDNSTKVATTAYVDSAIGGQDTLAEILANGNTTGGTDIAITAGDKITNFTSTGIDDNATSTALTIDSSQNATFVGNIDINGNNKHIRFVDTFGNWLIEAGDGANNFKIHSQSLAADYLTLEGGGQLNLGEYGSGSFTGTATYRLAVDSSGDVIEIPIGGGAVDGSGTANTVTMWSDTDTITNAPITISGNNATFAGNITFGATNPFQQGTNVLDGTGTDGARIRSAVSSAANPTFSNSDDTNTGMFFAAADTLGFTSGGTERMRIDSSGNVGVGVTPESWGTSGNTQVIRISTMTSLSEAFTGTQLASNFYFDGTNDKYILSDFASSLLQIDGEFRFRNASSGTAGASITWNERMRIDSSGDVSIGNAASFGKLRVGHIGDNTNALVIGDGSTPANDTGIYMRSDTLGVISVGSTASFSFRTGGGSGTERMRIDSSGKVLINQTSSATTAKLQVDGDIDMTGSAPTAIRLYDGVTFKGGLGDGQWAFGSTDYANDYAIYAQNDLLFHAGTGSSIDMMIDASTHNVGIGTETPRGSSAERTIHLSDGGGGFATVYVTNNAETVRSIFGMQSSQNLGVVGTQTNTPFAIYTNDTERMRIIDTGYIKARGRNTTAYEYPTNTFHSLEANESNEPTLVLFNDTTSNAYGLNVINGTDHNNTTSRFFLGQGGSTERIKIFSNGNVANTNNSYTALSDIKLKENITDATPKLNDLMQVKIRNYNLIGEELKQIGVVAQELEEVFPALVYETPDTERQDINKTDEEGNIIYQTEEVLVSEAVEGQEAIEWEDKPTIDNTKVEIQTWLDENSIEWQSADTKQELLDRIPEYQQEAIEAQDAVYETRETDIPETVNKEVDLGTTTKAVKYSVFVPMLIKAMQEQQEIINDLKARIEALEN